MSVNQLLDDCLVDLRARYFNFKVGTGPWLVDILIDVFAELIFLQGLLFKLKLLLHINCPPDKDKVVVVDLCNRFVPMRILKQSAQHFTVYCLDPILVQYYLLGVLAVDLLECCVLFDLVEKGRQNATRKVRYCQVFCLC